MNPRLAAATTAFRHRTHDQMPDLTRTIAYQTGPRALQMAGVTHKDIDLAMIYDSFTYTALVTIESLVPMCTVEASRQRGSDQGIGPSRAKSTLQAPSP